MRPYKQGDIVFNNWVLVTELGTGSFGKVWEAHREEYGQLYISAVKIITIPAKPGDINELMSQGLNLEQTSAYFHDMAEKVSREFVIMSKLKDNPGIVNYEDHVIVPHEGKIGWDILIRMEKLTPFEDYYSFRTPSRNDVIRLGIDICRALEACMDKDIIHRDIKPSNVFVGRNGGFKLGDFGLSRVLNNETGNRSLSAKVGNLKHMAPEVYNGQHYTSAVDIYSLGMMMYILLNKNRSPFLKLPPESIFPKDVSEADKRRLNGERLPKPADADEALSRIVLKACEFAPENRYSSPAQMRTELEKLQNPVCKSAGVDSGSAIPPVIKIKDSAKLPEDPPRPVNQPRKEEKDPPKKQTNNTNINKTYVAPSKINVEIPPNAKTTYKMNENNKQKDRLAGQKWIPAAVIIAAILLSAIIVFSELCLIARAPRSKSVAASPAGEYVSNASVKALTTDGLCTGQQFIIV